MIATFNPLETATNKVFLVFGLIWAAWTLRGIYRFFQRFARLKKTREQQTIYSPNHTAYNEDRAEIERLEEALKAVNNKAITITAKAALKGMEIEIYRGIREILSEPKYSQFLLLAQVSLGEIFNTRPYDDRAAAAAYYAFNARRSDLVIVNTDGLPVLIIEYQGGGHFQKSYYLRDEIKRRVFQKAKVRALEIAENLNAPEAAARVREQLDALLPASPASAAGQGAHQ